MINLNNLKNGKIVWKFGKWLTAAVVVFAVCFFGFKFFPKIPVSAASEKNITYYLSTYEGEIKFIEICDNSGGCIVKEQTYNSTDYEFKCDGDFIVKIKTLEPIKYGNGWNYDGMERNYYCFSKTHTEKRTYISDNIGISDGTIIVDKENFIKELYINSSNWDRIKDWDNSSNFYYYSSSLSSVKIKINNNNGDLYVDLKKMKEEYKDCDVKLNSNENSVVITKKKGYSKISEKVIEVFTTDKEQMAFWLTCSEDVTDKIKNISIYDLADNLIVSTDLNLTTRNNTKAVWFDYKEDFVVKIKTSDIVKFGNGWDYDKMEDSEYVFYKQFKAKDDNDNKIYEFFESVGSGGSNLIVDKSNAIDKWYLAVNKRLSYSEQKGDNARDQWANGYYSCRAGYGVKFKLRDDKYTCIDFEKMKEVYKDYEVTITITEKEKSITIEKKNENEENVELSSLKIIELFVANKTISDVTISEVDYSEPPSCIENVSVENNDSLKFEFDETSGKWSYKKGISVDEKGIKIMLTQNEKNGLLIDEITEATVTIGENPQDIKSYISQSNNSVKIPYNILGYNSNSDTDKNSVSIKVAKKFKPYLVNFRSGDEKNKENNWFGVELQEGSGGPVDGNANGSYDFSVNYQTDAVFSVKAKDFYKDSILNAKPREGSFRSDGDDNEFKNNLVLTPFMKNKKGQLYELNKFTVSLDKDNEGKETGKVNIKGLTKGASGNYYIIKKQLSELEGIIDRTDFSEAGNLKDDKRESFFKEMSSLVFEENGSEVESYDYKEVSKYMISSSYEKWDLSAFNVRLKDGTDDTFIISNPGNTSVTCEKKIENAKDYFDSNKKIKDEFFEKLGSVTFNWSSGPFSKKTKTYRYGEFRSYKNNYVDITVEIGWAQTTIKVKVKEDYTVDGSKDCIDITGSKETYRSLEFDNDGIPSGIAKNIVIKKDNSETKTLQNSCIFDKCVYGNEVVFTIDEDTSKNGNNKLFFDYVNQLYCKNSNEKVSELNLGFLEYIVWNEAEDSSDVENGNTFSDGADTNILSASIDKTNTLRKITFKISKCTRNASIILKNNHQMTNINFNTENLNHDLNSIIQIDKADKTAEGYKLRDDNKSWENISDLNGGYHVLFTGNDVDMLNADNRYYFALRIKEGIELDEQMLSSIANLTADVAANSSGNKYLTTAKVINNEKIYIGEKEIENNKSVKLIEISFKLDDGFGGIDVNLRGIQWPKRTLVFLAPKNCVTWSLGEEGDETITPDTEDYVEDGTVWDRCYGYVDYGEDTLFSVVVKSSNREIGDIKEELKIYNYKIITVEDSDGKKEKYDLTDDNNEPKDFEFDILDKTYEISLKEVIKSKVIVVNPGNISKSITHTSCEGFRYYYVDVDDKGNLQGIQKNDDKSYKEIRGRNTLVIDHDYYFAVKAETGYNIETAEITTSGAAETVKDENGNDISKNTFEEVPPDKLLSDEFSGFRVFVIKSISTNHTISGNIKKFQYKINFKKDPAQAVSYVYDGYARENISVDYGENVRFKIKILDNYNNSSIKVYVEDYSEGTEGKSAKTELNKVDDSYLIPNVTKDKLITVEGVELNIYKINFIASEFARFIDEGGNVVSGPQDVQYKGSYVFSVQTNEGYTIGEDTVVVTTSDNGVKKTLTADKSGKFKISSVVENFTVEIKNVENVYYKLTFEHADGVSYLNDTGSVITESIKIKHGKNYEFSVNIDDAYDESIPGMFILVNNGQSVNTRCQKLETGKYLIPNITEDVTIKACNVVKNTYTVTLVKVDGMDYYDANNKIITGDNTVSHNDTLYFKVNLYPAYSDSEVKVMLGKEELKLDDNGFYAVQKVIENKTVTIQGVEETEEAKLINEINNLPDKVNDLTDVDEVIAVSKKYENLPEDKKGKISNIGKLNALQEQVKAFHHVSNDVKIDDVDWYLKLIAIPISSDAEACGRIYKKLNSEYILELYDVYLWDTIKDVRYTLPEGKSVRITLPAPNMTYFEKPTGIHEKTNGKLDFLSLSISGLTVSFTTESFSPMGIVANRTATPGRSSLLDAADANVEAIMQYALSGLGSGNTSAGGTGVTGITGKDSENTDSSNKNTSGNIDEKFKSANNKVSAQASAIRLLLILMLLILLAVMVIIILENVRKKKTKKKGDGC